MKRRDFKNLARGEIYHIYNRGVNREKIFRDEQDYRAFLFRLGLSFGIEKKILNQNNLTKSPRSRIRISPFPNDSFRLHAFCLMPNHFHLLIEQLSDIPVSTLLQKICTSFSMYMNLKHKRIGHLFQGNFKSVRVESNPQLIYVSSYIHMNPVKDKLAIKPEQYKWSSYGNYTNNTDFPLIYKNLIYDIFGSQANLIKQTLLYKADNENLY
ncbi:MAG: hypothetical protein COV33_01065 [Candidatus Zambryskibacteria bacterium CG10_big_fil_rev_8_21_14_0_10_34_34]|uniref:Transposase IS200-like domain-containing protein n=1 Tax=Candidatus Zambryskibacteria bacterium CG10_big_fil_rev_8_21_14_0_10_34_34 TaxID=1975114 RepID=A0A2H0R127_9BACT|nr:MAG: hypothetical protein COV33_01065 [Candidatus Zambryskibacteria bacterium CG10_big_fil_rev_8_21_14_0_10_34_34]